MLKNIVNWKVVFFGAVLLICRPVLSYAQQPSDHHGPDHQQDAGRHQPPQHQATPDKAVQHQPIRQQSVQHQQSGQRRNFNDQRRQVRRPDPNLAWARRTFAELDAMMADMNEAPFPAPVDDILVPVVVAPVTSVIATAPVTITSAPGNVSFDTVTVNLPNSSGGYTTLYIKRYGNGFIGPQGEFYPNFPTSAQLMLMYGK